MIEKTFYDNTPFEYGYSSKDELISNMNPLLKKLMELNKGKVFCDIGCGCGRNLVYACRLAKEVIGIDLSKESLDFASNFVKSDNLHLKQGDNLDIPLESSIADVVISDGVCHHTGDTVKAFSECVRILRAGGSLYLAVYKRYRYYPFIYYVFGGMFRLMNRSNFGNFLVETVFVWPGMAKYGVEVILAKDLNGIVATALIITTFYLVINMIVDFVVLLLNPRISLKD